MSMHIAFQTLQKLQHAEAAALQAAQQHVQAVSVAKAFQHSAEGAEELFRLLR